MNQNEFTYLCRSFYLKRHPVLQEKLTYKENYCRALAYFVRKYYNNSDMFAFSMLEHYCCSLLGEEYLPSVFTPLAESEIRPAMGKVAALKIKQFKLFTYRFVFMVDCLFLCAFSDEDTAKEILHELESLFNIRYHRKLEVLFSALYHGGPLEKGMDSVAELISFWFREREFFEQPIKTVLVTATMSAGKSTLINAVVGKRLMRTAQEACTGHICQLYNKPFEDGENAVRTDRLIFDADADTVVASENVGDCQVASGYRTFVDVQNRVCIIDTPGVNSAINRSHGTTAKKALQDYQYDLLVYVLNANQLGTDDEISYLKYIAENVPKEKVIFVLNKTDTFKKSEDSIKESMRGVKDDLVQLGYEAPAVYPISAYFSLLIKLKLTDVQLDEDEKDEFAHYIKKYGKPEHDLTRYYDVSYENASEDILTQMSIRCGLYGLENILFGA